MTPTPSATEADQESRNHRAAATSKPGRAGETAASEQTEVEKKAAEPTTAAAAAATASASASPSEKGWTIIYPDALDAATVKAVWASQAFGVNLTVAASVSDDDQARLDALYACQGKKLQKAALVVLSGGGGGRRHFIISGETTGGNAMALAIAAAVAGVKSEGAPTRNNSKKSLQFTEQCWTDEWCEWERCVLSRTAVKVATDDEARKKSVVSTTAAAAAAALAHLEQSLTTARAGSSSPCHLVGHSVTVADICVATTLFKLLGDDTKSASLSPAVQRFVKAHEVAYQAAVAAATKLQQEEEALMTPGSSSSNMTATAAAEIDMNEPSLLKVVDAVFRSVVKSVFGEDIALPTNIVKACSNPKHGDFQLSAAMPIFAALPKEGGGGGNVCYAGPQQVAAAIVEAVGSDHPVVTDVAMQGPGFVLCRLRASYLQHHVNVFLRSNRLAMPTSVNKQTCVVDFSSPNIAKEMHVGHLRSTIIGEAVCRILEAAGHAVHRVNHVGDWGTQFGMLIQYLKEEYPSVIAGNNDDALPNITDLTAFYKNAKQRFDENADFKEMARTNVVKLQSGDAECLMIWKMLCDVSRQEFQKVYTRLDVTCEECGESFYNDKIPAVIDEFAAAGKIKIEEGGAKCVFVDEFKVPLMLQKSDGGYGYDSTDMAALKYRLYYLKADRVIVITDFSQGDHFKMVFQAGRDIGWLNAGQRLQHIGFGTVQGEDGKKFKTRSGDTVRLVDLLDEAVNRMETELRLRIDEGQANITADEVHEVAEAIGYGAVKYYDLRRNPTSNYKFSYDQMLDTRGDTAVYLLYARVRLESIAAKAAADYNVFVEDLLKAGETIEITHPSERNLALQLQLFTDTMDLTLDDLYPYHICEYVYKLATAASDFVTQCRVLGSPEMKSRVLLCHATTSAMRQCFDLLGIRHVKRI